MKGKRGRRRSSGAWARAPVAVRDPGQGMPSRAFSVRVRALAASFLALDSAPAGRREDNERAAGPRVHCPLRPCFHLAIAVLGLGLDVRSTGIMQSFRATASDACLVAVDPATTAAPAARRLASVPPVLQAAVRPAVAPAPTPTPRSLFPPQLSPALPAAPAVSAGPVTAGGPVSGLRFAWTWLTQSFSAARPQSAAAHSILPALGAAPVIAAVPLAPTSVSAPEPTPEPLRLEFAASLAEAAVAPTQMPGPIPLCFRVIACRPPTLSVDPLPRPLLQLSYDAGSVGPYRTL